MQMIEFPLLSRIWVLMLVLALTGCPRPGFDGMSSLLTDDQSMSQTYLEQFEPRDDDYEKMADSRKEVRKETAMNGFGTVDREDDPLSRYLNAILEKIVAASPVPDIPARVVIVDLQKLPTAFAMKDGTIYIPFKLLADMDENPDHSSEDALAFLLAHELSHLLYFHHGSDVAGHIFEAAAFGIEVGGSMMGLLNEITGKKGVMDSAKEELDTFYRTVRIAQFAEETAFTPAWTRKQENQADLLGFDLMIDAGYNPNAAYDFMDFLETYEKAAKNTQDPQAPKEEQVDLVGDFIDNFMKRLSRTHATVSERRETLIEYHERWENEIGDAEDIDYRVLGWRQESRVDGLVDEADADWIRKLFDNYEASRKAELALYDGDHKQAKKLVQKSLSTPTQYNGYPRIIAADYYMDSGEREKAIDHIRSALKGPNPSFRIYWKLLQCLDDQEEKLAVLDEAEQRFGQFIPLMRLRATTLADLDREEEAREAESSCYHANPLSKQRNECYEPLELPRC